METISVALWATNVAAPIAGVDDWLELVDRKLDETRRSGARLLMMPEMACQQWLTFRPPSLPHGDEVRWLADCAAEAVARLAPIVKKRGVGLLAGTMPAADEDGTWTNRAHLFLPDGRRMVQDQLCRSQADRDRGSWCFKLGNSVNIARWNGLSIAMIIGLDAEQPALAAKLAAMDIDLVLVPARTTTRSGYHRLAACARTRAEELETVVCVVGGVGTVILPDRMEWNISGAAAFTPCEDALHTMGVAAEIPPVSADDSAQGPILIARDLPIGLCRKFRHGAAATWPGPWTADHVNVVPA